MIKPLAGYVLVEPIKEESKMGGVYIPEDANDKPCKGIVVALGNGVYVEGKVVECPVKKGETAIFKKWVNQEVKFEGKDYLLVKFDELLATL